MDALTKEDYTNLLVLVNRAVSAIPLEGLKDLEAIYKLSIKLKYYSTDHDEDPDGEDTDPTS